MRVSSSPLRSRHKDGIRLARNILGQMHVREHERKLEETKESSEAAPLI